jgi:glutamate racemase
MNIGVFDSGIGGEVIAHALKKEFPNAKFAVVNDRAHLPYGSKTSEEIRRLTDDAVQPLLGSDVIIIACNTATAVAIDFLRAKYPDQFFIGIEPMIKTAAARTKSRVVAVCATPATLKSQRYRDLKSMHAPAIRILEPDCSTWAQMIEDNVVNEEHIRSVVQNAVKNSADVIVLGCTHYHWIKDFIIDTAGPSVIVLEPSDAIGRRIREILTH